MSTSYTTPFFLIHRDGKTWECDCLISVRHLCNDLGIIGYRAYWMRDDMFVGPLNMLGHQHFNGKRAFRWIVRDAAGRTVSPGEVWSAGIEPMVWERHRVQRHAASLGLPIPFTGKRRWRRRHKGAHIAAFRLCAAIRSNLDDDDFADVPRGKMISWGKKEGLPPNPWDYDYRGRYPGRNWKRFRRTRWRP